MIKKKRAPEGALTYPRNNYELVYKYFTDLESDMRLLYNILTLLTQGY